VCWAWAAASNRVEAAPLPNQFDDVGRSLMASVQAIQRTTSADRDRLVGLLHQAREALSTAAVAVAWPVGGTAPDALAAWLHDLCSQRYPPATTIDRHPPTTADVRRGERQESSHGETRDVARPWGQAAGWDCTVHCAGCTGLGRPCGGSRLALLAPGPHTIQDPGAQSLRRTESGCSTERRVRFARPVTRNMQHAERQLQHSRRSPPSRNPRSAPPRPPGRPRRSPFHGPGIRGARTRRVLSTDRLRVLIRMQQ
jgi:hypothetical protein